MLFAMDLNLLACNYTMRSTPNLQSTRVCKVQHASSSILRGGQTYIQKSTRRDTTYPVLTPGMFLFCFLSPAVAFLRPSSLPWTLALDPQFDYYPELTMCCYHYRCRRGKLREVGVMSKLKYITYRAHR